MLRRGDSSASDSSRGRAARPLSFPNAMYFQNSSQVMSSNIQEMNQEFKHVSIGKDRSKVKRGSLTESEASDVSTALSINR